jgi:hypothetical protein
MCRNQFHLINDSKSYIFKSKLRTFVLFTQIRTYGKSPRIFTSVGAKNKVAAKSTCLISAYEHLSIIGFSMIYLSVFSFIFKQKKIKRIDSDIYDYCSIDTCFYFSYRWFIFGQQNATISFEYTFENNCFYCARSFVVINFVLVQQIYTKHVRRKYI